MGKRWIICPNLSLFTYTCIVPNSYVLFSGTQKVKSILAILFNIMEVNEHLNGSAPKRMQKHNWRIMKSGPYDLYAIFQDFWSFVRWADWNLSCYSLKVVTSALAHLYVHEKSSEIWLVKFCGQHCFFCVLCLKPVLLRDLLLLLFWVNYPFKFPVSFCFFLNGST